MVEIVPLVPVDLLGFELLYCNWMMASHNCLVLYTLWRRYTEFVLDKMLELLELKWEPSTESQPSTELQQLGSIDYILASDSIQVLGTVFDMVSLLGMLAEHQGNRLVVDTLVEPDNQAVRKESVASYTQVVVDSVVVVVVVVVGTVGFVLVYLFVVVVDLLPVAGVDDLELVTEHQNLPPATDLQVLRACQVQVAGWVVVDPIDYH